SLGVPSSGDEIAGPDDHIFKTTGADVISKRIEIIQLGGEASGCLTNNQLDTGKRPYMQEHAAFSNSVLFLDLRDRFRVIERDLKSGIHLAAALIANLIRTQQQPVCILCRPLVSIRRDLDLVFAPCLDKRFGGESRRGS